MSSQVIDGWKPIHGVPGKTIVWQNIDGSYTVTIDPLAIGDGNGDMLKSVYDADGDNIVDLAESVPWSGVADRPTEFNPSAHTHDGDDITSQVGSAAIADSVPWSGVTDKPTAFPPSSHDHDDRYYTESETDSLLAGYVLKSIFDANTILIANSDDTPVALSVGASSLVGRAASGGIAALSASDARTVLGLGSMALEAETGYAKLAGRGGGQTLIGGTAANTQMVLQSNSATGNTSTAAAMTVLVGDSGATTAMRIEHNGRITIGSNGSTLGYILNVQRDYDGATSVAAVNTNVSSGAMAQNLVRADTATYTSQVFSSAYSGTLFGFSYANSAFMRLSASGNVMAIGTGGSTPVILFTADTARLLISGSGQVGIATTSPTISDGVGVDINGKILRLRTSKTPASASASGNVGEICWDSNYLYICTATNTWRRVAHSSW